MIVNLFLSLDYNALKASTMSYILSTMQDIEDSKTNVFLD